MQNLPANIVMVLSVALHEMFKDKLDGFVEDGKLNLGKLIKSCFQAPPGMLFCGADFAQLEARIDALTTKDPMKLAPYVDGFDSHALASFFYFREQMPDINAELQGYFEGSGSITVTDAVGIINSIKERYPKLRQKSKAVSFALQYAGTYMTLVKNSGFTVEDAKRIVDAYHNLYTVSLNYKENRIRQASKDGYATVAFGLRVRTPLLHQVVRGNSKTPHEAEAEGRTIGNALSQSYCMLNNRAMSAFLGKVRASKYRLDVLPLAMIHDAIYVLIRDDVEVVEWVNNELVGAMSWQALPELIHSSVQIGAELDIHYLGWHQPLTLKNGISEDEIFKTADKGVLKYGKTV